MTYIGVRDPPAKSGDFPAMLSFFALWSAPLSRIGEIIADMKEGHRIKALAAAARCDLIGDPRRPIAEGMDLAVGTPARRDGTGQQLPARPPRRPRAGWRRRPAWHGRARAPNSPSPPSTATASPADGPGCPGRPPPAGPCHRRFWRSPSRPPSGSATPLRRRPPRSACGHALRSLAGSCSATGLYHHALGVCPLPARRADPPPRSVTTRCNASEQPRWLTRALWVKGRSRRVPARYCGSFTSRSPNVLCQRSFFAFAPNP
jgi:hypothetical protein